MCLRYALTMAGFGKLAARLRISALPDTVSRYNISPTQEVPAIFSDERDRFSMARWGIEGWHDHLLFNARGESVDTKFRESFLSKRCLMAADAFYEWEEGSRRPFRFSLGGDQPFMFAGIYREGPERRVCMITTSSNPLVGKIHDRMPVILEEGMEMEYLEASAESAKGMLKPYPAEKMVMRELGKAINSPRTDSADLIKPKAREKTVFDYE